VAFGAYVCFPGSLKGRRRMVTNIQRVNSTSALQIHSIMFRFHPSVKWTSAYPNQEQIKEQIVSVWKNYGLEEKTIFETTVRSVRKDSSGQWVINDDLKYGTFDGVIAAIGSCGDPQMVSLPNHEQFKGPTFHSSELDGKQVKGKKVLIIGDNATSRC